jgi:hypothetical protein
MRDLKFSTTRGVCQNLNFRLLNRTIVLSCDLNKRLKTDLIPRRHDMSSHDTPRLRAWLNVTVSVSQRGLAIANIYRQEPDFTLFAG